MSPSWQRSAERPLLRLPPQVRHWQAASDCAIELEAREDTDAYMPMTSRLAHLAVLDVLAAGVTLRRGEALQPHLRAIKESLRDTRLSHTPASESNTA
jgi:RpiR family carbohydrate utilization transcriptional regulator